MIAISALEAAGIVFAWRLPYAELGWQPISPGAIEAARACPPRIFNRYNDGGYLIWFVPGQKVFSDTRQDPYPLEITRQTVAIENGGPSGETFARYGVRCALVPADSPVAARLRTEGWQPRFADDSWTVLTSPAPGAR